MQDDVLFAVKIDRGYIEYSERYAEIGETQYGVVSDIKYAKLFGRVQANRIIKKYKLQGKYAEKVEVKVIDE